MQGKPIQGDGWKEAIRHFDMMYAHERGEKKSPDDPGSQ